MSSRVLVLGIVCPVILREFKPAKTPLLISAVEHSTLSPTPRTGLSFQQQAWELLDPCSRGRIVAVSQTGEDTKDWDIQAVSLGENVVLEAMLGLHAAAAAAADALEGVATASTSIHTQHRQ